jgi:hypothetical protein
MSPFRPAPAATVLIDVSGSSQRVKINDNGGMQNIRIMNNGTATVWVGFGGVAVTASLTADFPVGPGVTEVLTAKQGANGALYVAAIAAGSTGKIYFTPGSGI